jgi:hypothetical protein
VNHTAKLPPALQGAANTLRTGRFAKGSFILGFPISLCPAPSIGGADGSEHADCLSPAQKRGEFPRAPAAATTRRIKRDMGVFFCFVFFHVKENEEIAYNKSSRIDTASPRPPPKLEDLDQI